MSTVSPDTTASVDGLRAYLGGKGLEVTPTVGDVERVEGADVAVLALGSRSAPAQPQANWAVDQRHLDPRSPQSLGVRNGGAFFSPPRRYSGPPAHLWVYTFDGPVDLARVRESVSMSRDLRFGFVEHVAYVRNGLVVVAPKSVLSRALAAAFGEAQAL